MVKGLLDVKFISEVKYTKWLSNMVLVKKVSGKWRMCVDNTDLNQACLKDLYLLPNIEQVVDNLADYQLLSFMELYSRYNEISMFRPE